MRFDKKTLFILLFVLVISTNVLEILHINFLYTTTLIAFCTCILLPGFLISLILGVKKLSFWENLLFMVGLSLAMLEFGGWLSCIILPWVGLKTPLGFQGIIFGFDIYVLFLFNGAWIRTKPFVIQVQLPRRSTLEKWLYTLPVFFPVLAALGAIILNNGGSNILTLILLGAIACYSLLLVLSRNKIAGDLYPYAIFFIGLASLFTTSLRSWYITGHDIEREFYVFQLTNTHHVWNMAFYQDAYNACLSITILPTILSNFLAVPDIYVYKVIFQILFATTPVLAFFIIKKYTTPVLAFLSAFFFISFPTFFNDMAMLNRQEIAFIFFGLAVYMLLLSELPFFVRRMLFVIFGFGIFLSHYSTNFVFLILIAFVYILMRIISQPFVKKIFALLLSRSCITLEDAFRGKMFLNMPLIILFFIMTFMWNTVYTNSSTHVGSVVAEVVNGIFAQSSADTKSGDVSYSIFSSTKIDPKQKVQNYIKGILQASDANNYDPGNTSQFYSKSITSKYPVYSIPQEKIPPTPLGNWLASFHIPVFNIQAELRSLSASFMQILVFLGLLSMLFLKNEKQLDLQYLLLCFGSIFLLGLITVLPALSAEYGVLRMFQQLLFLLSLPLVLGINSMLFFIKKQKRSVLIAIIAIFLFLDLTGFISHITGDYYPQMTLDNSGLYYDAFYVHKSDILAIVWISKNNVHDDPVEADLAGENKMLTYGDINALSEIFPTIIQKKAYVYQEVSDQTIVSIDSDVLIYSSSKHFLDDNKDLIYSNGKINVYK